jgi:hypothetical protein
MLAPVTHILPLTTIRRERILPIPGRVTVRSGQKVKPTDVVAEANLSPEHLLLQVARGLGVSNEAADSLVDRKAGDNIVEGDVIATRGGFARRVIRAPASGRVVMVGEGQVLIEVEHRPFQLVAGLPGNVIQIVPDRGAVIQTTGALIQAVWGNGRIDFGLLQAVTSEPNLPLAPENLDVRMRGSIVLAGHCNTEEALAAATDMSLRGLILGSISARLVPMAARLRFPVIVIEGFGNRSMAPSTFKLLHTNDNREVVLNGEPTNRLTGVRPEVIIPLPAPSQTSLPQDAIELAPGRKVRITRAPMAGAVGTVGAINRREESFPSGVRGQAARVTLNDGETLVVPLANLEILE